MHLRGKKAQATTELAIFGSLILVIFGALLSYGQRLNEEQAVAMDAFRYAVQRAGTDNGFVSYSVIRNKNLYDLMGSFLNPQSSSFSGSSTVLWAKGEASNKSYYRINDDEKEMQSIKKKTGDQDEDGDDIKKDYPVEVWDTETSDETGYAENYNKTEGAEGITTTQEGFLRDKIKVTLKTRYDQSTHEDTEDYIDTEPKVFEQCLYRDVNGVMRYSENACASNSEVYKKQKWSTLW